MLKNTLLFALATSLLFFVQFSYAAELTEMQKQHEELRQKYNSLSRQARENFKKELALSGKQAAEGVQLTPEQVYQSTLGKPVKAVPSCDCNNLNIAANRNPKNFKMVNGKRYRKSPYCQCLLSTPPSSSVNTNFGSQQQNNNNSKPTNFNIQY